MIGAMTLTGKSHNSWREICPNAALSITNSTQTGMGLNCDEWQASCLSQWKAKFRWEQASFDSLRNLCKSGRAAITDAYTEKATHPCARGVLHCAWSREISYMKHFRHTWPLPRSPNTLQLFSLSLLCSITIHCNFYSDLYHISDRCTGTFRSPAQVSNFFSVINVWLIISKTVRFTENVYWTLNVSFILLYNTCSKHSVTPVNT